MTALAVAHPHAGRPRRLRPVPDLPPEPPVTVTISVGGGAEGRERILSALRDLVDLAGPAVEVAVDPPGAEGAIRLDPDRVRSWDHRKLGLPVMELGGTTAAFLE